MAENKLQCGRLHGREIPRQTCVLTQEHWLSSPDEDAAERNMRHCQTCDHRIAEPEQGRLRFGGAHERMAG